MEEEILNVLRCNSMYWLSVTNIFRELENKSGGKPAVLKAANRLAKKKLVAKQVWCNHAVSFTYIKQ